MVFSPVTVCPLFKEEAALIDFASYSLALLAAVFVSMAAVICFAGVRLAKYAEDLARRTGLGQAITGAIFLGAVTSLSGITTSVTAAWDGLAELAASNAVGGIAAQTSFLAVADFFYRKANLEHAAASDENILQGALLLALCGVALVTAFGPDVTFFAVHPGTVLLLAGYLAGQRVVRHAQMEDMWQPRTTAETQQEDKDNEKKEKELLKRKETEESIALLWAKFLAAAAAIGFAGYVLAKTGAVISDRTGLNQSIVGGLFTAVATSLPELITAIAAVRNGALNLAVANVIGGNAFDVIFLSVSDVAYREGSLYHDMGGGPAFLLALTVLLTSIVLMGLVRREKHGVGNIGFESALVLVLYVAGFAALWSMG